MISNYEISRDLYNIQGYSKKIFCCRKCEERFVEEEKEKLKPGDNQEFFITTDMFHSDKIIGWIYKITKRSTGEFYVGQTRNVPVFRWGQHLKTERFPVEDIRNYIFEVIDEVRPGENILEKEKFWIQKCYMERPDLSLNISCTKNIGE